MNQKKYTDQEIIRYFQTHFNINLLQYNENEIKIIVNTLTKKINETIIFENQKNKKLLEILDYKKKEFDSLLS